MTRQQFDDLYLGKAVHCDTEEKANAFLKLAHDVGYKWCAGKSLLEPTDRWSNNKEFTYYVITRAWGESRMGIRYGNLRILNEKERPIVEFKKENNMKFKVGDKVRVLPNKMIGKVTDISEGFVILDDNQARPYMPQQLELALQRYVLLSDNAILDTKGTEYYLYEQNKLCGGGGGVIGTIKKSSDNIIDLVDVGDLVGYRFWGEDYEHIGKMHNEEHIKDELMQNGKRYVIVAIYKRQANGDYKRYEVKE